MAAGRPVVATRVEGVEQLLGSAARSQCVEFGDDAGFVGRVKELLQSAELASRIGDENRARAESKFSITAMVAAYGALYEGLLA